MTCQQSGGGASPAYVVHIFGRGAIGPAAAPSPLAIEAAAAAAYDDLQDLIARYEAGPAGRRIGKLHVARSKPRRLDARIVKRRPMMLVKRRLGRVSVFGRLAGREIIART